jgi:hypothetical protein
MEGSTPETEFQPGDICTQSGVYQVIHRAHRLPHKVVLSKGDPFPLCQRCGNAVRFWLITRSGTEVAGSNGEAFKRGAGESS